MIVEAYPAKSADAPAVTDAAAVTDAPAVTDAAAVTDASAVTDDHLDQSQGSLSGMPRMHNWDSRGTRLMTVCISRAWMRGYPRLSLIYDPIRSKGYPRLSLIYGLSLTYGLSLINEIPRIGLTLGSVRGSEACGVRWQGGAPSPCAPGLRGVDPGAGGKHSWRVWLGLLPSVSTISLRGRLNIGRRWRGLSQWRPG